MQQTLATPGDAESVFINPFVIGLSLACGVQPDIESCTQALGARFPHVPLSPADQSSATGKLE